MEIFQKTEKNNTNTWNEKQKSVYIEETKEDEYGKLLIKHGNDLQKIYYRENQQKFILFESKSEHKVWIWFEFKAIEMIYLRLKWANGMAADKANAFLLTERQKF